MKRAAMLCLALALTLPVLAAPAPRSARDVVVRGGRNLSDLIARATRAAWKDRAATRPVAVVIDVTPHTHAAKSRIEAAFEKLGDTIPHLEGSWRIGALGRTLSDPVRHPSALAPRVGAVLTGETAEPNTLRALRKTLGGFTDRGGLVLYLADWRFEDDDGLESFVSRLTGRGQTFTVIGTEACFGRGWNDGLPRFAFGPEDYEPGIGRNPFGTRKPDAPWHGGDTAYPHAPYSFTDLPWQTEFALFARTRSGPLDLAGFEDLRERLGQKLERKRGVGRYPLASAFGPYALMRTAAETGGHYYLLSWSPERRVDLVYDYARCNLFEPDLRPRREILATARGDPIPASVIRAWRALAKPSMTIVAITPPLTPSGAPASIDCVAPGGQLRFVWQERSEHEGFLRGIEKRLRAVDTAILGLDRALSAPPRRAAPWPRYRADAELFLHTLRVFRFELAEAGVVAREVPADAWDDEETMPGLDDVEWLPSGRGRPRQRKEAGAIRAARVRHLEKYGGTPFGETVDRNPVVTWRIVRVPRPDQLPSGDLGRTPSESGGESTPTRRGGGPGGASGGGGGGSTGR